MKAPKKSENTPELRSDGWERFEKAVDVAVSVGPKLKPSPVSGIKLVSADSEMVRRFNEICAGPLLGPDMCTAVRQMLGLEASKD